jgi:hypothetical protein
MTLTVGVAWVNRCRPKVKSDCPNTGGWVRRGPEKEPYDDRIPTTFGSRPIRPLDQAQVERNTPPAMKQNERAYDAGLHHLNDAAISLLRGAPRMIWSVYPGSPKGA